MKDDGSAAILDRDLRETLARLRALWPTAASAAS